MVKILKTLLAGVLLSASFPPINLWFLAPISLAIFYNQLVDSELKLRLQTSLIYAIFFFAPLLHWSSIFVGALPWLILSIGESLFFLFFAIVKWKKDTLHYARFAALWVLIELAREKFPFGGFGWGRIGFSQIQSPLSFYLPIIGVAGLSFLTLILAVHLADQKYRRNTFITFVLLVALGYGTEKLFDERISQNAKADTIRVTLIQGGVPQADLDFNSVPMAVFDKHYETTLKFLESEDFATTPTDLIIWPENASDLDAFRTKTIADKIANLKKEGGVDLLIGAVLDGKTGPENVAIHYRSNGEIVKYVKRDLAPFGEYIPLRTLAEKISPLARNVVDFQPGKVRQIFRVKTGQFTPLICFELLDDQVFTESANESNFLVSMTNNATFGKSSEAAQQFLIARVRAYEMRKVTAVVSTTGFTGFIDSKGGVALQAKQFESTTLSKEINLHDYRTPISRHRSAPEIAACLIFAVTFLRRKRG